MNRSPMELAIAFAVVGCVLAASAPSCVRNLHARRAVEAENNLERIAEAARAHLAQKKPLEPAPLTPAAVPRGAPTTDPEGTWEHATWTALGFSIDAPHWYSYEIVVADPQRLVRVVAHGDLDGDGVLSTYERAIRREANGDWSVDRALVVTRDLE
jgi:hypothetical protein